ncbi:MAG: hypothetical protein HUU02_05845 [Bacteroidetes bacterium]|nr:hypothetical protein [Bacteroidota bacterium]
MKSTLLFALTLLILIGCKDEETTAPPAATSVTVTDAQLYQLTMSTHKAAFYKNSTDTIPGNSGAAHAGKVLVWYNAKAKEQLDAQGKVKSGASFADSSLIVKEIFNSSGTKLYYAIMFKLSNASNKGAGDWVWSELNADGSAFISAADKGAICGPCHSTGIAYTRMNDTHP